MTAFKAGLAVLSENSDDIEQIITRIGLGNLIRIAPSIIRIIKTVADNDDKDPAEEVEARMYYGKETEKSVRAFQERHGLTVDGIVGKETWEAALLMRGDP